MTPTEDLTGKVARLQEFVGLLSQKVSSIKSSKSKSVVHKKKRSPEHRVYVPEHYTSGDDDEF